MREKMQYRPDIDGLRAVSVLGVILFHFNIPYFSGGFVGVDVFFVISGYLIGHIIIDEASRGSFSLLNFYERRIRRILPALFAVMSVTAVFAYLFYMPDQFAKFGSSVLYTVLFLSNIYFWAEGTNYFVDPIEVKPLLHTWSLAIEEQFYLIFPVYVLLVSRIKNLARRRTLLAGGVLLALAGSLGLSIVISRPQPMAAFYLAPSRAWELMIGVVLALGIVPVPRGQWARQLAGLLGGALIVLSMVIFTRRMPFPSFYALAPCIGAALIILAGEGGKHAVGSVLESRPAVLLGKCSYSIYLWHWPFFTFFIYCVMRPPTIVEGLLLAGFSVAVSFLSWRFIEQPFRRRTVVRQRVQIYALAGAATAFGVLVGAVILVTHGLPSRIDPEIRKMASRDQYMHPFRHCHGRDPADIRSGNICQIGDKSAVPTFIITGDSHADMQVPALDEAARRAKTSGFVMTRGGCAPLVGVHEVWNEKDKDERKCEAFNRAVADFAVQRPSIKKVFLAAFWRRQAGGLKGNYFVDDQSTEVSADETQKVFKRSLVREIDALPGKEIFVVADVPYVGYDLPMVIARNLLLHKKYPDIEFSTTKAAYLANQKLAFEVLDDLAEKSSIRVLRVDDVLCPDGVCKFIRDGRLMYRDKDHLSYDGAMMLVDTFFEALRDRRTPLALSGSH